MGEKKPKAERRKAAAKAAAADGEATQGKAAAEQPRKAKRRQAREGRRERAGASTEERGGTALDADEIETRLARIEEAVASQAERSEALSAKLDEVLQEARKSARHAKSAAVEQASD